MGYQLSCEQWKTTASWQRTGTNDESADVGDILLIRDHLDPWGVSTPLEALEVYLREAAQRAP